MNPDLSKLQTYPFEKLAQLKAGITPTSDKLPIALSIGAPKHTPPSFVATEMAQNLDSMGNYPPVKGSVDLRQVIADWLVRRFNLAKETIDPDRHIIPVNGTREALFSFAQAVVDRSTDPFVIMPNPFYQIYEGATLLAGANPWYLNTTEINHFLPNFKTVPDYVWKRCQMVYLCTPGNPTGAVMNKEALQDLIELSDRHNFVIASDECYSEIYFDEAQPPAGLLQAAHAMGRDDYKRCVVFHSLSKRSNIPGLRSGFVAGDAELIDQFFQYRTYHGCAMPAFVQETSRSVWADEQHVIENRSLYREKFKAVLETLSTVFKVEMPKAAFYLWPETPIDDKIFARELYAQQNVSVLPGSYLSRHAGGINPGKNRVRMALVATTEECIDAAERIVEFVKGISRD